MSDVFLFLIGSLVTLVVSAAVGLLFWGAMNEPRPGAEPSRLRKVEPSPRRESGARRGEPVAERVAG